MKKLLLILALFFMMCGQVWAAGTVTISKSTFLGGNMIMLKFACVGDSANGSFPATASVDATGGYITRVIIDPGATQPTALYDLTLTDITTADLLEGLGADLSQTATKSIVPYYSDIGVYGDKPFMGALTLTITNNAVNSAIVDVYVFVRLKD